MADAEDDSTGEATVTMLKQSLSLARRITGHSHGSLGLHPAIYFYGPTGKHSGPMFMGTAILLSRMLRDNNKNFFREFTGCREAVEKVLIDYKTLIATILQKQGSRHRERAYASILESLIAALSEGSQITDKWLVEKSGLEGEILTGESRHSSVGFTDDVKSKAFIATSLEMMQKCGICNGYLDPQKSLSYDHKVPIRDAGRGAVSNLQLTHPYCNQAIKC